MALKLAYRVQTRPNTSSGWTTIAAFVNRGDAYMFAGPRVTIDKVFVRLRFAGKTEVQWTPQI